MLPSELNYLKLKNKELYFIHIPKNAGTSIINQFFDIGKIGTHFAILSYPKDIWEKTFAISRNPYDRLISCYNYFKMDKSYWHSDDGSTPYELHELYTYCNNNNFEIFVKDLCINNKFNNIHLQHQYKWVITPDNNIVTKILKLENINNELSSLLKETINLIKVNGSTNNDNNYYTEELREIVYKYYQKDFEYFKYDKY